MDTGIRSFIALIALVVCSAHAAAAQQIKIEGYFPRQLPIGQATVISVAVPSRDPIQSAEISPSQGVTVSAIRAGAPIQGALRWSEVTIDVAKDAASGDRTLVLVLPMGRTLPVSLVIPNRVPRISELKMNAASNPSTVDVQFAFADAELGESPYVWFTTGCGGDPLVGVVRGKVTAKDRTSGVVRAVIPKPATAGACDTQVRVTDAAGIESNTLRGR